MNCALAIPVIAALVMGGTQSLAAQRRDAPSNLPSPDSSRAPVLVSLPADSSRQLTDAYSLQLLSMALSAGDGEKLRLLLEDADVAPEGAGGCGTVVAAVTGAQQEPIASGGRTAGIQLHFRSVRDSANARLATVDLSVNGRKVAPVQLQRDAESGRWRGASSLAAALCMADRPAGGGASR